MLVLFSFTLCLTLESQASASNVLDGRGIGCCGNFSLYTFCIFLKKLSLNKWKNLSRLALITHIITLEGKK